MRKSQTTVFYFYFFIQENLNFVRKYIFGKNLVCIVRFALPFLHEVGYWKCSNTNAGVDIHWFCRSHTYLKKLTFPQFAFNFLCDKGNFSLIHRIHSFQRALLSSQILPVVSKSYIQTNSKNSGYQIFLISKSSPIYMSYSRTQTDSYWNMYPEF